MNKLKYTQPAKFWEEALPLGNGRLGAMIFGGISRERIQLNEDTIWSGRPGSEDGYTIKENIGQVRQLLREKKYAEADKLTDQMTGTHDSECYQMAGDIFLDFAARGKPSDYNRTLDLATATSITTFKQDGKTFTREAFISAPHQVMAVKMTADQPGSIAFTLSMSTKMRSYCQCFGNQFALFGQAPLSNHARRPANANTVVWEHGDSGGIKYVMQPRVMNSGGEVSVTENTLRATGADEVILLIAIQTDFISWDREPHGSFETVQQDCARILEDAANHTWEELRESHVKDFGEIYDRMTLDLGATDESSTDEILDSCKDGRHNPALANLVFNFGRYLLISCSRPGTQPANLQGIWNQNIIAPWRSNYTTNINTEMNYWPAETCNLSDCTEPLLTFVRELSVSGKRAARELYGARGWCLHHNSDLWRYPYTGGSKAQHAFWPVCSAWLCQHLWEHYAFSGDRTFLAEAMPLMKEAAAFLIDFMIENEDGQLITSPSTSPENRFFVPGTEDHGSVCEGSAMDLTMIRELFENIIEGSTILGDSDEMIDEVKKAYSNLAMPKIGSDGRLLEFSIEAEEPQPGHRHISHLYGVYPGWMFTPEDNAAYYEACRKSLNARGDKSTGWAMGWRVAMWARFLDGNRALKVMSALLTYVNADASMNYTNGGGLYANLFDAHPPFQIDGNFGVTAGIAEMLVQSHRLVDGKRAIDLLPALPDAWSSGKLTGLRARGAVEITAMEWEDGVVTSLTLTAEKDSEFLLRYNDNAEHLSLRAGETFNI